MKKPLWEFTDNQGTFASDRANKINTLYFPLCNSSPLISSITPSLHGDIKTGFDSFLLEPVSRLDLSNLKSSRNFWVYINPKKIWSATGVSKDISAIKDDRFSLEAGLLWHKVARQNKRIGLKAEIVSFVPASGEPVEITQVKITNSSSRTVKFRPTAAIPLFARSAHNLHDHRHVTSLLSRLEKERFGITVKPTLLFNEAGHKINPYIYFALGLDEQGINPEHIYATYEEFVGDSGDPEAPEAILNNLLPDRKYKPQGKEALAGLRFKAKALRPGASYSYIILLGVTQDAGMIRTILRSFDSTQKIELARKQTAEYWQKISREICTDTANPRFDGWLKWVTIQPVLRKISGCSFLPDFDYGKGGRGWRDLWQDCLSLLLNNPREASKLLVNNFAGVRIDGSNATIIGQAPGEFIADRNNVARVWMDHGIWPCLTTHLYIQQSGDLDLLFKETPYFMDCQLSRSRLRDEGWSPQQGNKIKTLSGEIYQGSILEHLLIQNLVQFFNVGPHNHVRLENADWNDGLDMASEYGESVAFSCMYARNLKLISELLERTKTDRVMVFKEMLPLLDSLGGKKPDYSDICGKQRVLENYFQSVRNIVSGEKISLGKDYLIADLKAKAEWMHAHIRTAEWLKEGFFNGYYNNDRQRVEGNIKNSMQMTLTGQVFPVMSGIATPEQIKTLFASAQKYLKDPRTGGFRLNTDFGGEQSNLGRAFSFVYGDKENGAFFNHMSVMFAYALYSRGLAKEGYEVISSIYEMALDTQKSKIYPCLPEYFNAEGRGMYSYLTGSASWFILTMLTRVFGVRGEYGDLVIEPKLVAEQFKYRNSLSVTSSFAERPLVVKFINPSKKDFGAYAIRRVAFNQKTISQDRQDDRFFLSRQAFLNLANNQQNILEIVLD